MYTCSILFLTLTMEIYMTLYDDLEDLVSQFGRNKIDKAQVIEILKNITRFYYQVDLDNLHLSIIGIFADRDEGIIGREVADDLAKDVIFNNIEYESKMEI